MVCVSPHHSIYPISPFVLIQKILVAFGIKYSHTSETDESYFQQLDTTQYFLMSMIPMDATYAPSMGSLYAYLAEVQRFDRLIYVWMDRNVRTPTTTLADCITQLLGHELQSDPYFFDQLGFEIPKTEQCGIDQEGIVHHLIYAAWMGDVTVSFLALPYPFAPSGQSLHILEALQAYVSQHPNVGVVFVDESDLTWCCIPSLQHRSLCTIPPHSLTPYFSYVAERLGYQYRDLPVLPWIPNVNVGYYNLGAFFVAATFALPLTPNPHSPPLSLPPISDYTVKSDRSYGVSRS